MIDVEKFVGAMKSAWVNSSMRSDPMEATWKPMRALMTPKGLISYEDYTEMRCV